ncbi:fumarylacetoacetate hydrolase family protein [Dongia soli]|uniref:Fumarylacetoacetate hydrolase family protein n=1 Tax=Dongia soli TaxID=600628 RepID=A0ABU5E8Z7_9PROT|nr:fumarylacetoacetate hydrolase family protein [Dongia soli]MDY0882752.1 fumarylacetoacetate hydrolase family protein [Dongia soli]
MKLASLNDGSRDGQLVLVSRDLAYYTQVSSIARTLQMALDRWDELAPHLAAVAESLEHGAVPRERFHEHDCLSPLPRAYQWADGSAYVNHVELVRRARGAELPQRFWTDPLMYQGGSDCFLAPRQPITLGDIAWGLDFEAEIAVITTDVPMVVTAEAALGHIALVMLVNDVSLRNLIPEELTKGFGFFQSKPSSAFSPVAVTPDELGPAWRDGRLHLTLRTFVNGDPFGRLDAGKDMTFSFGDLIAHAAKTRNLAAGSIIGSGTISNRDDQGGPGRPLAAGGRGYACIAEQRMVEIIRHGAAETPFMTAGDRIRIEIAAPDGHSLFGAIEQEIQLAG